MDEINEALKQLLLKIITTISSTKFWFCLLGMVGAGYLAYQTGGMNGAIIAISAFLGIPTVYTVTKAQQNVGLAKAGLTDVTRFKTEVKSEPKDVSGLWVFDLANFHRNVLATVEEYYGGVKSPNTIYYNAERLGMGIDAGSWENAKDYWEYIVALANDSYTFKHGEDIETCKKKIVELKGQCQGWDLASHAFLNSSYPELKKLLRAQENFANMQKLNGECDYSIYMAGEMARYY